MLASKACVVGFREAPARVTPEHTPLYTTPLHPKHTITYITSHQSHELRRRKAARASEAEGRELRRTGRRRRRGPGMMMSFICSCRNKK